MVATHGYSVEACPAPTPPPTFARWLGEEDAEGRNPLRDQYARAKEAQADYMAEELAELHEKACEVWPVTMATPPGFGYMVATRS